MILLFYKKQHRDMYMEITFNNDRQKQEVSHLKKYFYLKTLLAMFLRSFF